MSELSRIDAQPSATVDVVVAGAGAAGLVAALACAESGCDVLLIEARESFRSGCNTALSTGMVPAAGSRWQAAAGVDDSPERFLLDVRKKTSGSADPVITEALVRVSAEAVEWIADRWSVEFELVTDFLYAGHSRHRCHAVPGRSGQVLHDQLLRGVLAHPGITLAVPMVLREALLDAQGAIRGARLELPGGDVEEVAARGLVLATNGYAANPELVWQHLPEIADGLYFGGDGSTGDALQIAEAIGADCGYLDAYQGHASVATPYGVLVTWAVVAHGGFVVNELGKRFGDESAGYSEYATQVLAQPAGRAWMIFDARVDELCRPFADYSRLLEMNAVRWASSVAELAAIIGCERAPLERTITSAATAASGMARDDFGRNDWEQDLDPPYAAVQITGALFHTQGGLLVDQHARALREGAPVPGLYAAGGAAAGMSGHGAAGYLAGNGLLSAVGLGYLAGRDVPRRLF